MAADVIGARGTIARISVGETPRVVIRCRSTSDQSRSGSGWVGRAVVEEDRRSERQRPDDLPGTHDPAEIGRPNAAPLRMEVHLIRDLRGDLHEEPPVDVEHALGRAGRAARVADEERMFALQRLRGKRIVRLVRRLELGVVGGLRVAKELLDSARFLA